MSAVTKEERYEKHKKLFKSKAGMELVQVAILIAIAIALGLSSKQRLRLL